MSDSNQATEFAVALLGEFIRRGVRDIVLSPGSRSQALALAAEAWERRGEARLQVRIDERSAGFLALGLAVESKTPVILITTSGTAVANLHPAALEAHHSGVPLILLTADRPPELRGIGTNQTTEQFGIFGSAVGWLREVEAPNATGFDADYPGQLAHEAYSAAAGHSSRPGPVQLNLAFREPLSGPVDRLPELLAHDWPAVDRAGIELGHAEHAIVIAGHGAGPRAEELARALGVPLLAEISSGSHYGPNLVIAYRELLRDAEFGGRVRRAIVFGHPTLSREVPTLLQRADVEVHIVRGSAVEAYNPGRRAARISDAVSYVGEPDRSPGGRAWLGSWVHTSRSLHAHDDQHSHDDQHDHAHQHRTKAPDAERAGDFAREQLAVFREPVTRRMLVQQVWQSTWPHDRLVFGASRLIRVADGILPGKKISVHSNRGLAGIDGTIATSIGIALASQRTEGAVVGVTRVLLGDLATLHDVGSLLFGVGESRPRIQVIVGNDGGGTIFDDLEVAETAPRDAFDRVLFTPQNVDFAALAAAYGWAHRLVTNRGELDEALSASDGQSIIEIRLPR